MPRMKNPRFVKGYYAASRTVSRWWHPESKDPKKNPFLPFRELFAKEAADAVVAAEPRGKSILDAGTGDGRLIPRLAAMGAKAICGLDLSKELLVTAQARRLDRSKVQFLRGDVENLPFRDSVFEVALCIQTLVHVPRAQVAVSELTRVTIPGGRLLMDITNKNATSVFSYFKDFRSIFSLLNATLRFVALYLPYGPLKGMGGPWRQYSLKEIEKIASECNLETLRQVRYGGKKAVYTLIAFRRALKGARSSMP